MHGSIWQYGDLAAIQLLTDIVLIEPCSRMRHHIAIRVHISLEKKDKSMWQHGSIPYPDMAAAWDPGSPAARVIPDPMDGIPINLSGQYIEGVGALAVGQTGWHPVWHVGQMVW